LNTIGVDPGLSGAIACIRDDGVVMVTDMPLFEIQRGKKTLREVNGVELCAIVQLCGQAEASVEKPHAMPGQGVTSMFNFGKACGVVDGVLSAMMIPVSYVAPATWKRQMGLSSDKGESRRRATHLYPQYADEWKRVKDDGRAEAVLLAHYLRTIV